MKRLIKENHTVKNYVGAFDYIDKIQIVFKSICSFTSVGRAHVGTSSASFTLMFSLTTGIFKKIINHNKKQKEKA